MEKERIFVCSRRGQNKGRLVLEGEKFGSIWVFWPYGEGRLIPEKTIEIRDGSVLKDYLKRLEKYYSVIHQKYEIKK